MASNPYPAIVEIVSGGKPGAQGPQGLPGQPGELAPENLQLIADARAVADEALGLAETKQNSLGFTPATATLSNVTPATGQAALGMAYIVRRSETTVDARDTIDPSSSADHTAALVALLSAPANAGKEIRLTPNATYKSTSRLSVAAGARLFAEGATIQFDRTDSTTSVQFAGAVNGYVEGLNLRFLTGKYARRVMSVAAGGIARDISIASEDQILRGDETGDDRQNYALRLIGAGAQVRGVKVQRFDRSVQVYNAADCIVRDADLSDYCKGVDFDGVGRLLIQNVRGLSISSNATLDPGNNFIGGTVTNGDLMLYDCTSYGSGEHGIYLANPSVVGRLFMRNVRVMRSGQSSIKMRRWKWVDIADVSVSDCSFGNASGTNEDGLRIEYSEAVTIRDYTVRRNDSNKSSFNGLYLKEVDDVDFQMNVANCNDAAVAIENCKKVRGHITGRAVGSYGVLVTPNAVDSTLNEPDIDITVDLLEQTSAAVRIENTVEPAKSIKVRGRTDYVGAIWSAPFVRNIDIRIQDQMPLLGESFARPWVGKRSEPIRSAQLRALDNLASWLEWSGVKSKIGLMHFFGVGSQARTALDLTNVERALTINGTVTFSDGLGITGDGTTGNLQSGIGPYDVTGYAQDNAHFGISVMSDAAADTFVVDQGNSTAGNMKFRLNPRNVAGNLTARLNSVSDISVANANAIGHYIVNRPAAASRAVYKDGVSIVSDASTATGGAVPGNMRLLRDSGGTLYDARTIGCFHVGAGLTAAEALGLSTRINAVTRAFA